jgi:outer membrane protein assembly factor BamB
MKIGEKIFKFRNIFKFFILIVILIIIFIMNTYFLDKKYESENKKMSADVSIVAFLNSEKLVKDMSNSVYDIKYYNEKLYVPDFRNNKLIIYDKDFKIIKNIFVGTPHSVAIDSNENIYVATYKGKRVKKFNKEGDEFLNWDNALVLNKPVSLSVDMKNNLYIGDYGLNMILKVSESGSLIKNLTLNGGNFLPHGLFIDGDYLYVVDRGDNKNIHLFDLNEGYIKSMNIMNSKDKDPLSITIFNNLIFIPNYVDSKIYVYDYEGELIKIIGSFGSNLGEFLAVTSITSDEAGFFYVVEEQGNRIQKLNNKNFKYE